MATSPGEPYVETPMRKATAQKKQSRVTLRMATAWVLSTVIPRCHESQSLNLLPSCIHESSIRQYMILQGGPRNPTAAQHGAKRRREEKEKGKTNQQPEQEEPQDKDQRKRQKGATKAKKETGAHRTGSETNTRAHAPQREETSHVQTRHKHARTQQ